jgi:hypothetical protein
MHCRCANSQEPLATEGCMQELLDSIWHVLCWREQQVADARLPATALTIFIRIVASVFGKWHPRRATQNAAGAWSLQEFRNTFTSTQDGFPWGLHAAFACARHGWKC